MQREVRPGHAAPKARPARSTVAALALAGTLLVGGTAAYLFAETDPVENSFEPSYVSCAVEEAAFNDGESVEKSNVRVQNTGDIDAYIRAKVMVNWVKLDANGEIESVLGIEPVAGVDYRMSLDCDSDGDKTDTEWFYCEAEDFWYYASPVAPKGFTEDLIDRCELLKAAPRDGYQLVVEIAASAIQSSPDSAVEDVWDLTVANGKISK